jgi:hypothetical protein
LTTPTPKTSQESYCAGKPHDNRFQASRRPRLRLLDYQSRARNFMSAPNSCKRLWRRQPSIPTSFSLYLPFSLCLRVGREHDRSRIGYRVRQLDWTSPPNPEVWKRKRLLTATTTSYCTAAVRHAFTIRNLDYYSRPLIESKNIAVPHLGAMSMCHARLELLFLTTLLSK